MRADTKRPFMFTEGPASCVYFPGLVAEWNRSVQS